LRACEAVCEGVRLACRLGDTAPEQAKKKYLKIPHVVKLFSKYTDLFLFALEQMSTEDFADECRKHINRPLLTHTMSLLTHN